MSQYLQCSIQKCRTTSPLSAYSIKALTFRVDLYVCDNPECQRKAHDICLSLKSIKNTDEIKTIAHLNVKQINIKKLQTSQISQTSQNHQIEAIPEWEWIDDFGYWMNVTGAIMPIGQLDMQELQEAVIAIRKVNIHRITPRISWVRELEESVTHPKYEYPPEKLRQEDIEEVYAKLEQFKEEYSP